MLWHRDRFFELIVDTRKRTLHFPVVLPEVPLESDMERDFRGFVAERQTADIPDHRRIDPSKTTMICGNVNGNLSLTAKVENREYEYATRKLINLVHEVYLVFLYEGRYYDYLVETFDLDPDHL